MVPSPPFVAITSFSRRAHWLSCYAHGGLSVSVDVEEWRGGPHEAQKRGNRRFLAVYERLYHKYEADKACIPEGNLIEVRFEDFEADALGMTKKIYDTLSLPGWEEARTAIEQYVGAKKGYKKNKYDYAQRTRDLVETNWKFALDDWGYHL